LAGIQVGKVDEVKFPQELNDTQIIVEMRIKKDYQDRIRKDSTAGIVTQGLLGDKAVFLTLGTPGSPELKDDEFIAVKQAVSLESFAEKGEEVLDNLNKLAKNIDGLVTDVKEKQGLLHALIYDPSGENLIADLAKVADTGVKVMAELKQGRGLLHALIYEPVRRDFGKVIDETTDHFRNLSKDLASVGQRIEKGEGSVGGLIKDPTVYYDLMTLLGKANRNVLLRAVIRATLATNEKDLTGK
jgi:phospholipid/cholesterol/gamma-HCH transport system substrate-binding protein